MTPVQHKRARTDEQKFSRRRHILDMADRQFKDVGFEAFSMARLAALASVAKGTLYLYFGTREEVFLALYIQKVLRWSEAFTARLKKGMPDEAIAIAFFETAQADETFLPLLLRMDHIIEHNVSIDSLVASKRAMNAVLEKAASAVAENCEMSAESGQDALRSLASLLIGAAHIDQAPSLEDEELPRDVRELIDSFSSRDTFISNATRILAGIRAGI